MKNIRKSNLSSGVKTPSALTLIHLLNGTPKITQEEKPEPEPPPASSFLILQTIDEGIEQEDQSQQQLGNNDHKKCSCPMESSDDMPALEGRRDNDDCDKCTNDSTQVDDQHDNTIAFVSTIFTSTSDPSMSLDDIYTNYIENINACNL